MGSLMPWKWVLLLKWRGCWTSVDLQRENDTADCLVWLPPSRVGCQSMLVHLQIQKLQKCPGVFSKVWKWMMWPKGFSRNSSYLISQGSVVLACEARLLRVCSRRSVFWPWCWGKDSIDVVALPYRGAWIAFGWNGEDGASEWAQHVSQCLIARF